MDGGDPVDERPAFRHLPVMAEEITALFGTVPPGYVLDATLGGGGHSEALLEAWPHLSILGIDRDQHTLAAATHRLARFGQRVKVFHTRFDGLETAMEALSIDTLSGALFDLGVSSPSSTWGSAASPTVRTRRSTCAWTRPRRGRPPTW